MRFVIYDDESMEPITVVKLRGFGERDIERLDRRILLPVPEPLSITVSDGHTYRLPRACEIRFEQFSRRGQLSWMAFTQAPELAMLLIPDWLPGQRSAVEELQRQADGLARLLDRVISERFS